MADNKSEPQPVTNGSVIAMVTKVLIVICILYFVGCSASMNKYKLQIEKKPPAPISTLTPTVTTNHAPAVNFVSLVKPKPLLVLEGKERITSWALSFDNTRVAVGSYGGLACIWDLRTGSLATQCKFHAGRAGWEIGGLAFIDNDNRLMGGCGDQKIRFWVTAQGELEGTGLQPGGNGICNAAATRDNNKVVLIDGNQTAYLVDIASGKKTQIYAPEKPDGGQPRTGLAISRDGNLMFIASESTADWKGWVEIWDVDKHVRLRRLRATGRCVSDISLTSNSKTFLAGWDEGVMRLYRTEDAGVIREFAIPNYKKNPRSMHWEITSLAISPDGKLAVAGLVDGRILIWHAVNGTLLHQITPSIGEISRVSFTPDGTKFLAGGSRTVLVWASKDLEN